MMKQPMMRQCRGRTPNIQPLAVHPAALHGCVLQSMVRQCMSYIPDTPDKVALPAAMTCCAVRCLEMLRCAAAAAKQRLPLLPCEPVPARQAHPDAAFPARAQHIRPF